ncbi:MAG: hypothetical protein ACPGXK_01640 [Phycisphaerae bacterium]
MSHGIEPVRVLRQTGETSFGLTLAPRDTRGQMVSLPNKLLGHFLDHLLKACRLSLTFDTVDWPGSWMFDHVLCEDVGQAVGKALGEVHDQLAASRGVPGRASTQACMDDAAVGCVLSFEGRARCSWTLPDGTDVGGFVDSWFGDSESPGGVAYGTNLQQFFDGLCYGAPLTLDLRVDRVGNLHHVYECLFRATGDAIATALNLDVRIPPVPGDTSGFAGIPQYIIESTK